ncbi:vesicle transport through interaction with t-snares 1a [Nannochloropsis gaditana]|uniref:Vesicle transport through interaction with t-snares 1a n=1 Tax=Nannochloropsis gaditana TaxID=72520 RepID=W7TNT4_9STRA|nr:vesicle transport through interaction with t-snares 1a [Nannochloropsis gaditana]
MREVMSNFREQEEEQREFLLHRPPQDRTSLSPPHGRSIAMTDIFESYEDEFRALAGDCQKKLSNLLTYETHGDKIQSLLRQASPQVTQLEGLIKQMKLEVRSLDAGTKAALSAKVQTYERVLTGVKADLGRAREREEKDALLGAGGGVSMVQRQRLLETSERLAHQNRTIDNARKVMAETEQVGIHIGEELESNREKIQSIRGKVGEGQGMTEHARKLVKEMTSRWF